MTTGKGIVRGNRRQNGPLKDKRVMTAVKKVYPWVGREYGLVMKALGYLYVTEIYKTDKQVVEWSFASLEITRPNLLGWVAEHYPAGIEDYRSYMGKDLAIAVFYDRIHKMYWEGDDTPASKQPGGKANFKPSKEHPSRCRLMKDVVDLVHSHLNKRGWLLNSMNDFPIHEVTLIMRQHACSMGSSMTAPLGTKQSGDMVWQPVL